MNKCDVKKSKLKTTIFTFKSVTDFEVLSLMTKIVKAEDVEFLGVDIGALVKKCPDITSDMLYAILSLRGDISKSDYKEVTIYQAHFLYFCRFVVFL